MRHEQTSGLWNSLALQLEGFGAAAMPQEGRAPIVVSAARGSLSVGDSGRRSTYKPCKIFEMDLIVEVKRTLVVCRLGASFGSEIHCSVWRMPCGDRELGTGLFYFYFFYF